MHHTIDVGQNGWQEMAERVLVLELPSVLFGVQIAAIERELSVDLMVSVLSSKHHP